MPERLSQAQSSPLVVQWMTSTLVAPVPVMRLEDSTSPRANCHHQESRMTEDEARELIDRLLGTRNPVELTEFEFGWLAKEQLSPEERAAGLHVGHGSFIIDRTGVVTAQMSLPVRLLMTEYSEARRQGRITGRQVWPKPACRTDPDRAGEH